MERRKGYPSDVTDEEWAFIGPYLALVKEDAPQRRYPLREVFNGLRYIVKTGGQWRFMAHDLPPWPVVYQQTRRWLAAGCFEAAVHDLRAVLRLGEGRAPQPTAAVLDSQTLQSTPESGAHAGYDGAKRKRGSKVHAAVGTLGHLLALHATPADAQDREQVAALAAAVQEATGGSVELAFVDQGYTGDQPARDAAAHGLRLEVVKLPDARRGFVLLPRRWVVETTQPQDHRDARLDETERAAHARCGGAAPFGRRHRAEAGRRNLGPRGRGCVMSGLAVVSGPPRLRWGGPAAGGSSSRRPPASVCWGCSAAC